MQDIDVRRRRTLTIPACLDCGSQGDQANVTTSVNGLKRALEMMGMMFDLRGRADVH
jgi:hypothetical protein